MRFDRQLRLLDALLRIVEASNDAMRIVFEQDVEVPSEIPSAPSSPTIVLAEEDIPEVLKPPQKPSRRPTRTFPILNQDAFKEHLSDLLKKARTADEKDAVRVQAERGFQAGFLSPEEVDELLLKLVPK